MTRSLRSSRRPCCTSRASASPRSASSERSWNSSNTPRRPPSSVGSSSTSRVNTPSVTTSIRVARETLAANRTRQPTVSPTASPKVAAMRAAAARAASRRGASTRIFFPAAQASPGEHERHPRGLAGARRRDQNRSVVRAQSAGQLRQRGIDRKRLCMLAHLDTRPTSPCRRNTRGRQVHSAAWPVAKSPLKC